MIGSVQGRAPIFITRRRTTREYNILYYYVQTVIETVNNNNGPKLIKYNFSIRFNDLNLPVLYKNETLTKSNSDLVMNSNGLNNNGKTEYVEIVDSIENMEQSFVEINTNNL